MCRGLQVRSGPRDLAYEIPGFDREGLEQI